MKFNKKLLLASLATLVFVATVYAARSTWYRRDTVATSMIHLLENDGTTTQTGASAFGSDEDDPAVPTTSNAYKFANWVPVYNPTTSSIPAYSLLMASNTGTGYVNISSAGASITNAVGVAAEAIGATDTGWMIPRGGGYSLVLSTGTIAIGDTLVSSGTVAGRVGPDNTPVSGADVGTAMSSGDAAGDTIVAILH